MKYYLIAGEASGDLHGSNLMKALKARDKRAQFRFIGGDLMKKEGGTLVRHYEEMAYMGFVEVVTNAFTILNNINSCRNDILQWQPDVVVLIDYAGFNLRIASFAKKNNILVCYYISPKVWAWKEKRVLKIKKYVDHMFCIFHFEVAFYKKWGMEVQYVGNPLLDAMDAFSPDPDFHEKNNLTEKPVIALLPGSRKQEIKYMLPVMLSLCSDFPDFQFVIAGAGAIPADFYKGLMPCHDIPLIYGATYDLLAHAKAAIITSGTATLEAALFKVPQVVVYKGNPLNIAIARLLIKTKYISLVNLIMTEMVVKELIQKECNRQALRKEMSRILTDMSYNNQMHRNYDNLISLIDTNSASELTANLLTRLTAADILFKYGFFPVY